MAVSRFTIQVTRTGRNVEVWQQGSGPDIVFLHGAGGLQLWSADLQALSRKYRVTVPIHPGFGQSDGVETIDGVLDSVLHTFDVLQELEISRPNLIGHSMGGMIAAEMAATCPNDVERLVLIAPVGLWDDAHPVLDFFTLPPAELVPLIFHNRRHPMAQAMAATPSDEVMAETIIAYLKGLSAAGRLLWPIPDRGLKKRIDRITAPTLILWGEGDGLVPVFYAGEFEKRIPGAKVKIIKKASHMLALEKPEEVVDAIRQFLRGTKARVGAAARGRRPPRVQSLPIASVLHARAAAAARVKKQAATEAEETAPPEKKAVPKVKAAPKKKTKPKEKAKPKKKAAAEKKAKPKKKAPIKKKAKPTKKKATKKKGKVKKKGAAKKKAQPTKKRATKKKGKIKKKGGAKKKAKAKKKVASKKPKKAPKKGKGAKKSKRPKKSKRAKKRSR